MAFDISQISSDFRNELEGGLYSLAVKEGTVWNMVEQMDGIAGKQDLNTLDFAPTWKDITSGSNVYDANYDVQAGSVNLDRQVIDVQGEWFNVGLNQNQLDKTYARASRSENPEAAFAADITAQAAARMRERVSTRFYTGFGQGTSNGFADISGVTTTATGTAAFSATTALAKLATLHAAFDGSTHAGATDKAIIMSNSDYLAYRVALRTAGLNDVLQGDVSVAGVGVSPWIDDTTISVISDPNYTGEPFITSLSNIVFGTKNLSENEQPDFFYSKDKNIYIIRGYIYGGVQALEPGNIFVNSDA